MEEVGTVMMPDPRCADLFESHDQSAVPDSMHGRRQATWHSLSNVMIICIHLGIQWQCDGYDVTFGVLQAPRPTRHIYIYSPPEKKIYYHRLLFFAFTAESLVLAFLLFDPSAECLVSESLRFFSFFKFPCKISFSPIRTMSACRLLRERS